MRVYIREDELYPDYTLYKNAGPLGADITVEMPKRLFDEYRRLDRRLSSLRKRVEYYIENHPVLPAESKQSSASLGPPQDAYAPDIWGKQLQ